MQTHSAPGTPGPLGILGPLGDLGPLGQAWNVGELPSGNETWRWKTMENHPFTADFPSYKPPFKVDFPSKLEVG